RSSLRTRNTRELCRGVDKVIAISGTPLVNRPAELWPILNILRPQDYPYFSRFSDLYCPKEMTPWGWSYRTATNLGDLHTALQGVMIRRLKKDVLSQLPELRRV